MDSTRLSAMAVALVCSALAAGCGSSSSSTTTAAAPTGATAPAATSATASTTTSGPGALSAEAQSAATGDIPDNQVFLVLHSTGFSMKYPEGWTIQGSGSGKVTIRDNNNLVRVVVAHGPEPTTATIAAQLTALKKSNPTMTFTAPRSFALPASSAAVKAVYTTRSAPSPVTGKRVELTVDRYVVNGPGGRVAIVDLGTPKGVDNVDAYRMMIESFAWK